MIWRKVANGKVYEYLYTTNPKDPVGGFTLETKLHGKPVTLRSVGDAMVSVENGEDRPLSKTEAEQARKKAQKIRTLFENGWHVTERVRSDDDKPAYMN